MAHQLDENEETGEKSHLSVGETPWHSEGIEVPRGDNAEFDLERAMELAGLNFEVIKSPNFVRINGNDVESGSYSTVRTDRNEILGTVGESYRPLQNEDAFSPLEPILNEGLATIETAGSLKGGEKVWMMVKFNKDGLIRRANEESDLSPEKMEDSFKEILPYSLFLNYHNGLGSAQVRTTAVRVVCNNTLQMSLRGGTGFSLGVRHTDTVEKRYKEATNRLFNNVVSRFSDLSDHRDLFRNTTVPEKVFEHDVLDAVVPVKHLEAKVRAGEGSSRTETFIEKNHKKRSQIRDLWFEGKGHSGDQSAWEAFNGVTQYLDHAPDAVRGDSGRVGKMIKGGVKDKKETVFQNLLNYSNKNDREKKEYTASLN